MKQFYTLKSFKTIIVLMFLLFSINISTKAQETIATGSYIIDMGAVTQTTANGLKPYGLINDLIANNFVPIKWVINPTKALDGVDFALPYSPFKEYKGGTFIIPKEFITPAVLAKINTAISGGVLAAPTTAPITVNVTQTLTTVPRFTFDQTNGDIAIKYLTNAGIPTVNLVKKLPAALDCCDDFYVMPHADPTWSTHGNLYQWNLTCKGSIWAACHAVSVLENVVNPANTAEKLNFLSTNGLVLFGSHAVGTPPYIRQFPSDPVSQYIGATDLAQTNGSEQIYIPIQGTSTWRPTTKIIVYDPSQANVPLPDLAAGNVAAAIVYGRGFGDPARGLVMYEAGHDHNKATAPSNISAQRSFLDFAFYQAQEKVPNILPLAAGVVKSGDILCSGKPSAVGITATTVLPNTTVTYKWSSSCAGTFSNALSANTTFTPASVAAATNCVITCVVTDNCGRTNFASFPIVVNPTPVAPTNISASPATICSGNSSTLSATCSLGIPTWYSDMALTTALTSNVVSPATTTTYYVSCVNGPCQGPSGNIIVNVVETPTAPTASAAPSNICEGSSSVLSATCTLGTLTWYSDALLTTVLTSTTVSPPATKSYYAVCINGICKSPATQVDVNVFPIPSAPTSLVASPSNICAGDSSTITGACATGTLQLFSNSALTIISPFKVSPATTSTYYAVCNTTYCTSPASQVIINVTPIPPAATSVGASPSSICSGVNVTLNAACAVGTPTWFADTTLLIPLASNVVTPLINTNYFVSCVNNNCKSPAVKTTVTVVQTPLAVSSLTASPSTICQGENSVISGTCSIGTFSVFTDALLTDLLVSNTVSPSTTTTYHAVCINGICKGPVSQVVVNVNPTPAAPSINPSAETICLGTSTTLNASGCSGTVNWYLQSNLSASLGTGSSINVSPTVSPTNYVATCTINGCVSLASSPSVITVVTPPPTPSISVTKASICVGETVTLTGINCDAPNILSWYKNGSATSFASGISVTETPASGTNTYTALCGTTGAVSCASGAAELTVTVNNVPVTSSISPIAADVCSGTSVNLTASGCLATETTSWSNGQVGVTISVSPSVTTNYTVKCINTTTGCESLASGATTVTVVTQPSSAPVIANPPAICQGTSTTLVNPTCTVGSPVWYQDKELTILLPSLTVNPSVTTSYYVTCVNGICTGPASQVTLEVTQIPAPPAGTVALPDTVCTGESTTLLGNCATGNITWYTDVTLLSPLASNIVSPTVNTSYYAACAVGTCKSTGVKVDVIVFCQIPKLELFKSSSLSLGLDGIATPGDTMTYVHEVTNVGNVTIKNLTVIENLAGFTGTGNLPLPVFVSNSLSSPQGTLKISEVATYKAIYLITQADINAGVIYNSAFANGLSPNNTATQDTSDTKNVGDPKQTIAGNDLTTSPILQTPKVAVVKASSLNLGIDGIANPGDVITYTYEVLNTGNVSLNNVSVVESPTFTGTGTLPVPVFINADQGSPVGFLMVGEKAFYTATYIITQTDLNAGKIDNQATASGISPLGINVNDVSDSKNPADYNETGTVGNPLESDKTGTLLPESPAIATLKASSLNFGADGITSVGDIITYTYEVINTGNVDLHNVLISETAAFTGTNPAPVPVFVSANLGSTVGNLKVGEKAIYEATYSISANDVLSGKIDNSAIGSGLSPSNTAVKDTSDSKNIADYNETGIVANPLEKDKTGTLLPPPSPIANSNTVSGVPVNTIASLGNILANDLLGNGTIPTPNSVIIDLSPDTPGQQDSLVVPGQGTWKVDTLTGITIFTPLSGFVGDPTPIIYSITEISTGLSDTAQLIADYAPKAVNDIGVFNGLPTSLNVIGNDNAGDIVDVTTVLFSNGTNTISVPGEGTWTVNSSGVVTFTPEPGFITSPTPQVYTVKDYQGNLTSATVTLNAPPIANTDSVSAVPVGTVASLGNILINDKLGSGATPTAGAVTVDLDPFTAGDQNTYTVAGEGTWAYNAATGVAEFTPLSTFKLDPTPIVYTLIETATGLSDTAMLIADYVPVATDNVDTYEPGVAKVINVLANDTSGDMVVPTTVMIIGADAGSNGKTKTVDGQGVWTVANDGTITFTPISGYKSDPTPINYTVQDAQGNTSNPALVSLSTPPIASDDIDSYVVDTPKTVNIIGNDINGDVALANTIRLVGTTNIGDPLVVVGEGTWTVDLILGTVTFTPLASFHGIPTPVFYTVKDAQGEDSNVAKVTLDGVPPVAVNNIGTYVIDTPKVLDVLSNDVGGDIAVPSTFMFIDSTGTPKDTLVIPNQGTWTHNDAGFVTFTPFPTYHGGTPSPVNYIVRDAQGTPSNLASIAIGTALSVDITVFKGKATDAGNRISWTAKNEIGFKHFELLRSSDLKEYSSLSIIKGTEKGKYEYFDVDDVSGLYYYKLKLVDLDGSISYSKVISVQNKELSSAMNVYPNPSPNREFSISTSLKIRNVKVFNSLGSSVHFEKDQSGEILRIKLDDTMAAGTYIIQIETNNGFMSKRVILE